MRRADRAELIVRTANTIARRYPACMFLDSEIAPVADEIHERAREIRDATRPDPDSLGALMWSEMRHGLVFDEALSAHLGVLNNEVAGWLFPLRARHGSGMSLDEWAEWWSERSDIRSTGDVLDALRGHAQRSKPEPIDEYYRRAFWAIVNEWVEEPASRDCTQLGRLLARATGVDPTVPF